MAKFTDGELEVMRILWEHGPQKPADIQEKFPRKIKNNALRSYLTILLEKGHVMRTREGRAFVYTAVTQQESAFGTMYRRMVNTFCAGSMEVFMSRLIKEEELSEKELLRLKKLADEWESEDAEPAKPRQKKGGEK